MGDYEMAGTSSREDAKFSKNDFSSQLLQKLMKSEASDVQFTFEVEGKSEAEKIPAHKKILAAASPVFDAMFNGELKEKGDVKIVDASPDAFREFLQFIYGNEMKLTMENIADVLNLTHKYDIAVCFQTAVKFLKQHLTTDKLIWGLQLALKYGSNDLTAFCKEKIALDPVKALNGFEPEDEEVNSAKRQRLSSTNSQCTLAVAFSVAKEIIVNQSAELDSLRPKRYLQFVLAVRRANNQVRLKPVETLILKPKIYGKSLWLREIQLANVYERYDSWQVGDATPFKGTVSITTDADELFFKQRFEMNTKYIKLPEPIHFNAKHMYSIIIETSIYGRPSGIVNSSKENPAFEEKLEIMGDPKFTFIDSLYFEELPNN